MDTQNASAHHRDWSQLEPIIRRFEKIWRSEAPPDIDEFLHLPNASLLGETDRLQLLLELVKVDSEFRWKAGFQKSLEDYLADFPQLNHENFRHELIEAEMDARVIAGARPGTAELKRRFGEQAGFWQSYLEAFSEASGRVKRDPLATVIEYSGEAHGSEPRKVKKFVVEPGEVVDRYILREELGRGAFAIVWRAIDPRLNRTVAIKILNTSRDSTLVKRLMREARAAASIDHPGVARVHEVGQSEDMTFVVQQFIDGPSLKEMIAARKVDHRRCIEIVRDIGIAAHAAHQCGVIHRDLKPANIMMADSQRPVIVDFGLACLEQYQDATLTQQGDLLGTPAYMSPQQACGHHHLVDSRTDVYAIGVILYRMLAGRVPFHGTTAAVISDVIHKPSERLFRFVEAIETDLETIVLKAVAKEPSDRYQSAKGLADDLSRWLNNEPIRARRAGAIERVWKWTQRNPVPTAVATALLMLSAILLGSLIQLRRVDQARTRAEAAEKSSAELFVQSQVTAARLAMKRGEMDTAVEAFDEALNGGHPLEPLLGLELADCLMSQQDIPRAREIFQKIEGEFQGEEQGYAKLIEAQLELNQDNYPRALELFQQAIEAPNRQSFRWFAEAMAATKSTDVIRKLRQSLEVDPLQHAPRRMLILMLFSLADFNRMEDEIRIALQLFPDDLDFHLLNALQVTGQGDVERGRRNHCRT